MVECERDSDGDLAIKDLYLPAFGKTSTQLMSDIFLKQLNVYSLDNGMKVSELPAEFKLIQQPSTTNEKVVEVYEKYPKYHFADMMYDSRYIQALQDLWGESEYENNELSEKLDKYSQEFAEHWPNTTIPFMTNIDVYFAAKDEAKYLYTLKKVSEVVGDECYMDFLTAAFYGTNGEPEKALEFYRSAFKKGCVDKSELLLYYMALNEQDDVEEEKAAVLKKAKELYPDDFAQYTLPDDDEAPVAEVVSDDDDDDEAPVAEVVSDDDTTAELNVQLEKAIVDGDEDAFKKALEDGADVNYVNEAGIPMLFLTIILDNKAMSQELTEKGADLKAKDKNGNTLLHLACIIDREDLLTEAIDADFDVNAKNNVDVTPLQMAVGMGKESFVRILLEADADVNAVNNEDWSPLMVAATKKANFEIFKLLLNKDADTTIVNKFGWSIPQIAAVYDNRQAFLALVEKDPALKKAVNRINLAARMAKKGNEAGARLLFNATDWKSPENKHGFNPFHLAVILNEKELVNMFILLAGDNLNSVVDSCKATPAFYAAGKEDTDILETLIESGADVNKAAVYNDTLLSMAVCNENVDAVKILLKAGAKVNERDEYHYLYAVHYAIARQNLEIVRILIEAGADLSVKTKDGLSLMDVAKNNCTLEQVEELQKYLVGSAEELDESDSDEDSDDDFVEETDEDD